MTVTYCPEDNKIRLYVGRVPRDEYETLREAGFVSTPKQDCDFVATWTPAREDLAMTYLDEDEDIGDEDYSPEERAADRAERFEGYRGKRYDEATDSADTFSGETVFGNQNQARAERAARKQDRHRTYATSQWSKAEYWQTRTAGVIRNALYKSSPSVRRGRILKIEAEIRQIENNYTPAKTAMPMMRKAYDWNTHTEAEVETEHVWIANGSRGGRYVETSQLEAMKERYARKLNHLKMRLAYENQMIGDEGGMASEADMVPGGWIRASKRFLHTPAYENGWAQIHAVSKSPKTGRVTSVKVMGTLRYERDSAKGLYLINVKVDRMGEDAYRAPTPEEAEAFAKQVKAAKAKKKASGPKLPKLINPTPEDAQRLQDVWNAQYKARVDKYNSASYVYSPATYKPVEVREMTMAEYKERSKSSYGSASTVEVMENGLQDDSRSGQTTARSAPLAFKVRKTYAGSGHGFSHSGYAVIIITDKPQKSLPLDWASIETPAEAVNA